MTDTRIRPGAEKAEQLQEGPNFPDWIEPEFRERLTARWWAAREQGEDAPVLDLDDPHLPGPLFESDEEHRAFLADYRAARRCEGEYAPTWD